MRTEDVGALNGGDRAGPGRAAAWGAALLAVAGTLGATQVYWKNFVDEADNLAGGLLIARGHALYRDVFSHHLPFPYYWVAAVIWLCGKSILAVRLSVLVFETTIFALAMALTGLHVPIGLAALVWQAIANPYYGNLASYHVFKGAALAGIFVTTLAVTGGFRANDRKRAFFLGILGAVAILSDGLAVYPVGVCLLALAASPGGARGAASVALVIATILLLSAATLVATGVWPYFLDGVVRFNAEVYRRYRPVDPFPVTLIASKALLGLDVLDPRWRNLDPMYDLTIWAPDRWLFTGFCWRFAVILTSLALFARRRPVAAVFVYLFVAALLGTGGEERFPATPLVLVGLLAACWFVTAGRPEPSLSRPHRAAVGLRLSTGLARVLLAGMLAWLALRGAGRIVARRHELSYQANFQRFELNAEAARRIACGRSDVALGIYPSDPLVYFFSEMPPVSRYLFLYPWVAEIALPDVIRELGSREAVVWIDVAADVWGFSTRTYLAPLIRFLDVNYSKKGPNLWASSSVVEGCQASPSGR